jgi:dTMP kinase
MGGKLIVFEGGEGSGKTTQIERLQAWLESCDEIRKLHEKKIFVGVKRTREPGGTAMGKKIRELLLRSPDPLETPLVSTAELLLYAADRAQHVEEELRPWLAEGYWVLCDRYTDSTVAYQGYGRQLDLALIETLNQVATGGLKSDLTLWLNVPPSVGLARMQQRGQADRIEQASALFHERVCAGFAQLAAGAALSSGPTVEIDGDRAVDAVADEIRQVVQDRLLAGAG